MFGHSGLSADLRWSVDDRVAVSVDELAVVGVLVMGPMYKESRGTSLVGLLSQ